jgi:hypothetical protein
MNIWDPFHPVPYLLHSALGALGILGALIAMAVTKGSRRHVLAGRTFAIAATIVAATGIAFSFTNFAPMSIASGVMTVSAIGSAVMALRQKSQTVTIGELVAATLMAIAFLWLVFGVMISIPQGGFLWTAPLFFAVLPAVLFINDVRFIRQSDPERKSKRLRRHFSRMAFALAIAVHAPVVVFSDDLHLHPAFAFYGPFVIWPGIFFYFNGRLERKQLPIGGKLGHS